MVFRSVNHRRGTKHACPSRDRKPARLRESNYGLPRRAAAAADERDTVGESWSPGEAVGRGRVGMKAGERQPCDRPRPAALSPGKQRSAGWVGAPMVVPLSQKPRPPGPRRISDSRQLIAAMKHDARPAPACTA